MLLAAGHSIACSHSSLLQQKLLLGVLSFTLQVWVDLYFAFKNKCRKSLCSEAHMVFPVESVALMSVGGSLHRNCGNVYSHHTPCHKPQCDPYVYFLLFSFIFILNSILVTSNPCSPLCTDLSCLPRHRLLGAPQQVPCASGVPPHPTAAPPVPITCDGVFVLSY